LFLGLQKNTGPLFTDVVKPLIRYPVSLLTLLLIVYTQLFAHLCVSDLSCPSTKRITETHFQIPGSKTIDAGSVYMEEESKRTFFKGYSDYAYDFDFLYTDVPGFFRSLQRSSFGTYFLKFTFPASPVFRVLRL